MPVHSLHVHCGLCALCIVHSTLCIVCLVHCALCALDATCFLRCSISSGTPSPLPDAYISHVNTTHQRMQNARNTPCDIKVCYP